MPNQTTTLSLKEISISKWIWILFVTIKFSIRYFINRKSMSVGIVIFALCLLIIFPFAYGTEVIKQPAVRWGALWTVQEFICAMAVLGLFRAEQEQGALEFILASDAPRSAILMGKMIFNTIQLFLMQLPIFVFWIILYNIPLQSLQTTWLTLLCVFLLFDLSTSSIGSLLSCVTARSIGREILLPILFFPMQLSVLLACVVLSLWGDPEQTLTTLSNGAWWSILVAYPVIFGGIGFLTGNTLLEE